MSEHQSPTPEELAAVDVASAQDAASTILSVWQKATILDGPVRTLPLASEARSLLQEGDPAEPYEGHDDNRLVVWTLYRKESRLTVEDRREGLRQFWTMSHLKTGPEPELVPEEERPGPIRWCADLLDITPDAVSLWLEDPGVETDRHEVFRWLESRAGLLRKMHRQRLDPAVEQLRSALDPLLVEEPPGSERSTPAKLREEVLERDGSYCQRCGATEDDGETGHRQNRSWLRIDHSIPVAHGGPTQPWNLSVLCHGCNQAKGTTMSPLELKSAMDRLSNLVGQER